MSEDTRIVNALERIADALEKLNDKLDLSEGIYDKTAKKPLDRIVKHLDDIDSRLYDMRNK